MKKTNPQTSFYKGFWNSISLTESDSLLAFVNMNEMVFMENMSATFRNHVEHIYAPGGIAHNLSTSEAHAASAQSNGKFKYAVHADADAWLDSESWETRD